MIPAAGEPSLLVATARADEIRAELLLRVAAADRDDGFRLEGSLTGPVRRRDTTLPIRVPLEARALPGGWSRATFTEPAYWTPELPNLYRLEARAEAEGRPSIPCDRMIGLRRLGVRGLSCRLDGRRWVPRGVSLGPEIDAEPLPALHERFATLGRLHAAAEMRDPADGTLAVADAVGVAVVARLEEATGRPLEGVAAADRMAAWAIHPSVMIVVVPRSLPVAGAASVLAVARGVSDTMLLAVEVDGTRPPDAVDAALVADAAVLVVDLPGDELPHAGWRGWPVAKPLIARCHGTGPAGGSPATADAGETSRRRCDLLQAALAAWGIEGMELPIRDWAGYLAASW